MVKLLGAACILGAGAWAWRRGLAERRRELDTLADLIALLDVGVHAPNPVLPEFLWSGGELFRLTDEPPFRVTAW